MEAFSEMREVQFQKMGKIAAKYYEQAQRGVSQEGSPL